MIARPDPECVSYALNEGGDPIDAKVAEKAGIPRNRLYTGRDGKLYIVGVKEMKQYLEAKYGKPTDYGKNADESGKGGDQGGGISGMRKRIAGKKKGEFSSILAKWMARTGMSHYGMAQRKRKKTESFNRGMNIKPTRA